MNRLGTAALTLLLAAGAVISPTSAVSAADDTQDIETQVPVRFLDTRPSGDTIDNVGKAAGPRSADTETQVQITGRGNIPSDATAAIINITAVNAVGVGFVTAYPCGTTPPLASTLNHTDSINIANGATIAIGSGGKICLFNSEPTNLILDVTGYVAAGADVATQVPARFLDTRPDGDTVDNVGKAAGPRSADAETQVQITGRDGIPNNATAAIINIVAVNPVGVGFVTVYPCGSTTPLASTLNHTDRTNIANGATIAIGTGGRICLFNSQPTNLILDVTGYVTADSEIVTRVPGRYIDTRSAGGTIDGLQQAEGARPAETETQVQITGRDGIPNNATAAIVNITAVRPASKGFVTAYPCGNEAPNASTLNYSSGINVANGATLAIGLGGKICLFNSAPTDLILDVNAYIVPATNGGSGGGTGGGGGGNGGGGGEGTIDQDDVVREFFNGGIGRFCQIATDGARCSGGGSNSSDLIVGSEGATAVGAGTNSSCASLPDGRVLCYGSNDLGQLGNGTTTSAPASAPAVVTGISTAVDVDAGLTEFACATLADGRVQCWGRNDSGQLGNGSAAASLVPVTVPGIDSAVAVSAGATSACALLEDRTLRCWGSGLLGNGTTSDRSQPVQVIGVDEAITISVGGKHACTISSGGQALCWGDNSRGQLGNGTTTASSITVAVPTVKDAVGLAVGTEHSCVRRANAQSSCWGNNTSGQVNNVPGPDERSPDTVIDPRTGNALTGVTAIGAGNTFTAFAQESDPRAFTDGTAAAVVIGDLG